ncbi:MAG: hypothetical protein FJ191_03800 [Gammaproteobacteria bacterium]|nr:hypothetical protein [Gammaproteobacteria bacterium]
MKRSELEQKYPDLTFEEIGPDEGWDEDPVGYCFVIEAVPFRRQVRATAMVDDLPRLALTGDSVGLRKLLVDWDINRDHLAYLAYELGRAEMAVRHDLPFLQE